MEDQNPTQQLGPGRPHHCASDASNRFGHSVVLIETSDGSSEEDIGSDSDFTVVSSRRLKRVIRRTSPSGGQAPKKAGSMRSHTISYVPTSTRVVLNSLNRQCPSEYSELVAPGQVAEIRLNVRTNILSVEVATKSVLNTLKAITELGNTPVGTFSVYERETKTGVNYDVDLETSYTIPTQAKQQCLSRRRTDTKSGAFTTSRLLLPDRKEDTDASAQSQSTQVQGNQSLALNTSEIQWPSLPSRATCTP
ncbi:hypothetical protein HPB52_007191 [Rhipicephalus sanguineus]|uniref:Uncharacterized protein n=1 Tax=Rhipicephalus sanguineus TaxID=34632 RepID=A0A9D4QI12_RHISA|nr:hypothetical protein HPB52_007191 [Rhipicephalus sanguineus]